MRHMISVGPCRGEVFGDMLEVMARIVPSQPNETMAHIAPRSPMVSVVNNKIISYVLRTRFKIDFES
jgi:hypothetical protein